MTTTTTTTTTNRMYRLSLSAIAALSIAACSDQPSLTGASPLPPAAHSQQTSSFSAASTNPAPQPDVNEVDSLEGVPIGGYTCADFGEVRLRVFERDLDIVVQYAIDGVPRNGFYWVRFWPEGRHNGEPIDRIIGDIAAGDGAAGEFVVMTLDEPDRKVTIRYNVDVDVARNQEDYENGVTNLGQCDRGGELSIIPPPKPECAGAETSIDGAKLTRVNYGNVRIDAYVSATNFKGTVELEWSNMGHTDIVAKAELDTACDGGSVTLDWQEDRAWLRDATFVVRILDETGRIVASKTYIAGALKNGEPDTWILR